MAKPSGRQSWESPPPPKRAANRQARGKLPKPSGFSWLWTFNVALAVRDQGREAALDEDRQCSCPLGKRHAERPRGLANCPIVYWRALSQPDFDLLAPELEKLDLPLRKRLDIPHRPIDHIYLNRRGPEIQQAAGSVTPFAPNTKHVSTTASHNAIAESGEITRLEFLYEFGRSGWNEANSCGFATGRGNRMQAPTVLVVEDEALVRADAVDGLKAAGFEVLEAEDGEAALVQVDEHAEIMALFTDVQLHGRLDGVALAWATVAHRPDLRVVITSGARRPRDEEIPARARFIPKPYHIEAVAHLLLGRLPN
jgi:CheY-like chemotaxis protein